MSATWEVQKALYTALSADSVFMNKIGSRLYDEPPTNETYPYVVLGNMIEMRYNRILNKGSEITARFDIYTKAGRMGFRPTKEINFELDRVLNHKIFGLNQSGYRMIQCFFSNSATERDEDKRIISAYYTILVQEVYDIPLYPAETLYPDFSLYPTFE